MKSKNWINYLLIALLAFSFSAGEVEAGKKSGGWGGSKSYSKPYKPSKPSKPKKNWNNQTPKKDEKKTTDKTPDFKTKAKPTKTLSKTDKAAYEKAFKSRESALNDFREKNKQKYTSKYATKPATRPEHIPQTTTAGGTTYNISYNQNHGGYGYYNALGAFIIYDAMTDVAQASYFNSAMQNQGYYYGPTPVAATPTVVHHDSDSGIWAFFLFLTVVALIFGMFVFMRYD